MLASACALEACAETAWELLVIDNGEGDEAAKVVEGFAGRLPIRRVIEPVPGLSHARNRGVAEAKGRHICWTDDDVVLDPGWLRAYAVAFRRFPQAVVFGGRVLPEPEQPSPAWFEGARDHWRLLGVMAHRDMGDTITPVTHEGGRTPYGANFAVRADAQRRFPYNPELGVAPGRGRVGEESDVIYRLLKEGGVGWWIPEAKVRHVIPLARQSWSHFIQYYRQVGETAAYLRDAFPRDNAGEVKRPPVFAFMGDGLVDACAAINRLGAEVGGRLGLADLRLSFGARQGFYEGVGRYRRLTDRPLATALGAAQ